MIKFIKPNVIKIEGSPQIGYIAIGNKPASASMYYGEDKQKYVIEVPIEKLKDIETIHVKLVTTDNKEYLAEFKISEDNPTPEPEPAPESSGHEVLDLSAYKSGTTVQITVKTSEDREYSLIYTVPELVKTPIKEEEIKEEAPAPVEPKPEPIELEANPVDPEAIPLKVEIIDGVRYLNGMRIFKPGNYWEEDISSKAVDKLSDQVVARMKAYLHRLHNDFGEPWQGAPNGIPITVVPENQPLRKVVDIRWAAGSEIPSCDGENYGADYGCFPIPGNLPIHPLLENVSPDTPIEEITPEKYSADLHVLILQEGTNKLYEFFRLFPVLKDGKWTGEYTAESTAIWDLNQDADRFEKQKERYTATRTSADAAGMPILPGLVLYDEVKHGEINHALRFTVQKTRRAFVYPATHFASWLDEKVFPADKTVNGDGNKVPAGEGMSYEEFPPMGARFRLKGNYDISGFNADVQVILKALKKYGMIMADNGGPNFISGAPDSRWRESIIGQLKQVPVDQFELVDMGEIYEPKTINAVGESIGSYSDKGITSLHVTDKVFRRQ